MITLEIEKNDSGQRLDKFLLKAFSNLPPSVMYKGIRTKKIKVNRKRAEEKQILNEGDTLQIFLPEEFFKKEAAKDAFTRLVANIDVLYEDEHILLIDKKPGMVVHSDDKQESGTLIDHVKAHLIAKGEYDPSKEQSFAPALCNRIDRNTGGIVLAAKDAESLRILNEQIKEGGLDKRYLCAVSGVPPKKTALLEGYLIKNADANTVKVYDKKPSFGDPKKILTEYKVLASENGRSLLEVHLLTGRTHQIRAHMAHVGHPLLGDGKYGGRTTEKDRFQALYSYMLTFNFKGDAGILSYLQGKSFKVPLAHIRFLSHFPSFLKNI
jgi:23S rRNA pseudouridine955/2504/2580 synthase